MRRRSGAVYAVAGCGALLPEFDRREEEHERAEYGTWPRRPAGLDPSRKLKLFSSPMRFYQKEVVALAQIDLVETVEPTISGLEFAKEVARLADSDRAEEVVVLDLRGISPVADFFVIATGSSDRQMRAIADHVNEYARRVGQSRYGISGYDSPSWLLADYVDVVVHLFDPAHRKYYDLELLWGDAPRVEWRRSATA